jgi:hypothetical protein
MMSRSSRTLTASHMTNERRMFAGGVTVTLRGLPLLKALLLPCLRAGR